MPKGRERPPPSGRALLSVSLIGIMMVFASFRSLNHGAVQGQGVVRATSPSVPARSHSLSTERVQGHTDLPSVAPMSLSTEWRVPSVLTHRPLSAHHCATPNATAPSRKGILLRLGRGGEYGEIRLLLRPEWSQPSAVYAEGVAVSQSRASTIYRLEPTFLIQGRLLGQGVRPNVDKTRAPKVMERGEVGWAGGGAGPDFFIYLGTGPAGWLGNPHDGTIFAEVADEASMAVANNVSLLPVPPTKPGQMHLLSQPLSVTTLEWIPPEPTQQAPRLGVLKVAGVAVDAAASDCDASCHALAHTELHGDVVRWGETHLTETAALCCASCKAHAESTSKGRPCNIWVYCSNKARCGKRHKQCWLKHRADMWAANTADASSIAIGTSDAWTAGTREAAPEDHPSGAGRVSPDASRADVALEVRLEDGEPGRAATLRLRLRREAPKAAALVRALADSTKQVGGGMGPKRAGTAFTPPAMCSDMALTGGAPAPASWGSEALRDGFCADERWPKDAALIRGTLGRRGLAAQGAASQPTAVEPRPVPITRGSVSWSETGGDGPDFFVALADMPHLGTAHTVWAEVVRQDLPLLDTIAQDLASATLVPPLAIRLVGLA